MDIIFYSPQKVSMESYAFEKAMLLARYNPKRAGEMPVNEFTTQQYEKLVEHYVKHRSMALLFLKRRPKNFEAILRRNPPIPLDYVPTQWVSEEFYIEYAKHGKIEWIGNLSLPRHVYTAVVRKLVEVKADIDPLHIDRNNIEYAQLSAIVEGGLKYDSRYIVLAKPLMNYEELCAKAIFFDHTAMQFIADIDVLFDQLEAMPSLIEHAQPVVRKVFAHKYDANYVLEYAKKHHQVSAMVEYIGISEHMRRKIGSIVVEKNVPKYWQREFFPQILEVLKRDGTQLRMVDLNLFNVAEYAQLIDAAFDAPNIDDSTFAVTSLDNIDTPVLRLNRIKDMNILRKVIRRAPSLFAYLAHRISREDARKLFEDAIAHDLRAIRHVCENIYSVEEYDKMAKQLSPNDFTFVNRLCCSPAVYEELAIAAVKNEPSMLEYVSCDEKSYANIAAAALEVDSNAFVYLNVDNCNEDVLKLVRKIISE